MSSIFNLFKNAVTNINPSKMQFIKQNMLYEGKAKIIYTTNFEGFYIQHFKNDITANNGQKKDTIENKGLVNKQISAFFFEKLTKNGVKTHLVKELNNCEQVVKAVKIIPLEVIVRNSAAGSFCKRFGIDYGFIFKKPLVEFSLKNDPLGDPAIGESQIEALEIATKKQIVHLKHLALKINSVILNLLDQANMRLVDFKIEFGIDSSGNILLADELSPDTMRILDKQTNKILDKDVYRQNIGNVMDGYLEVAKKLNIKILY